MKIRKSVLQQMIREMIQEAFQGHENEWDLFTEEEEEASEEDSPKKFSDKETNSNAKE